MSKKTTTQQELLRETPYVVTPGQPGDPNAQPLELIDDNPDKPKMDLRKFNKTKQKVDEAVKAVKAIVAIETLEQVNNMTNLLKALGIVQKDTEAKRKELGDPYRLEVERINTHVKGLVKDIEPAVKHGKDLILAFHKAEELKAKKARQEARIVALGEAGFIASPRVVGDITHIDWKLGEATITEGQVLDLPDDIYVSIITRIAEERLQLQVDGLQEQKSNADFFGEDEETKTIDNKINEVKGHAIPSAQFRSAGTYTASPAKGLTKRWTFEITNHYDVPREYLVVDEKKIREAIAAGTRSIPGVRIYQDESITIR